jgi:hypothetical protein
MGTDPAAGALTLRAASALSPTVRREQSARDLAHVRAAIDDWFSRWQAPMDGTPMFVALHRTRLEALNQVLMSGLTALATAVGKVDVSQGRSIAEVNADCREIDQAVVWMHRIWVYYREKFEQRNDLALKPTLAAADEVVWSCYQQVFLSGKLPEGVRIGPAPLAYVESEYSPAIWDTSRPAPSALRETTEIEGLESFLSTLPIPTLRLPPWSVGAPWWLVFVAHEVGHSIRRELKLAEPFRATIAKAWPASDREARARIDRWTLWDSEIFADLASVAMIGTWAIEGLRELLIAPADEMARATAVYPAPIVRLALMAGAADRFGMDGATTIAGIDPDAATADAVVIEDMADVDRVLDAVLGPLTDKGATLDQLCGVDAVKDELGKNVPDWADDLAKGPGLPSPGRLTPRYVLGGTFLAWQRAAGLSNEDDRHAALDGLATNAIEALATNGPPGTRAGADEVTLASHGEALADRLLARSRAVRAGEGGT